VKAIRHLHAIPVDDSLTPTEAWKEICIFGRRVTFTSGEHWTTVACDGEECKSVGVADAAF